MMPTLFWAHVTQLPSQATLTSPNMGCIAQVCKVYDPAELCRNVHSSPEWRAAAATAVMGLGGVFMKYAC